MSAADVVVGHVQARVATAAAGQRGGIQSTPSVELVVSASEHAPIRLVASVLDSVAAIAERVLLSAGLDHADAQAYRLFVFVPPGDRRQLTLLDPLRRVGDYDVLRRAARVNSTVPVALAHQTRFKIESETMAIARCVGHPALWFGDSPLARSLVDQAFDRPILRRQSSMPDLSASDVAPEQRNGSLGASSVSAAPPSRARDIAVTTTPATDDTRTVVRSHTCRSNLSIVFHVTDVGPSLLSEFVGGWLLTLSVSVRYGSVALAPEVHSPPLVAPFVGSAWNCCLAAAIHALPREAHIAVRVCATANSSGETRDVAWTTVPIFDAQCTMSTAATHAQLWPTGSTLADNGMLQHKTNPLADTVSLRLRCGFAARWAAPPPPSLAAAAPTPTAQVLAQLADILQQFAPSPTPQQRAFAWQWRHALQPTFASLVLLVRSVPIDGNLRRCEALGELHSLLKRFAAPTAPEHGVRLLAHDIVDTHVRQLGVRLLSAVDDTLLAELMPQLVQALKREVHAQSSLAHFVIRRATQSRAVGQRFFWLAKARRRSASCRARRLTPGDLPAQRLAGAVVV